MMGDSHWTSLGQPPLQLGVLRSQQFTLAVHSDGHLELLAVDSYNPVLGSFFANGTLWSRLELTPGGTWHDWGFLGQPPRISLLSPPSVIIRPDGLSEAFTIGDDQNLWYLMQRVLTFGDTQNLQHRRQLPEGVTPEGAIWVDWNLLDSPHQGSSISSPSVVVRNDGLLEVFVVDSDNKLWHNREQKIREKWQGWESLGSPPTEERTQEPGGAIKNKPSLVSSPPHMPLVIARSDGHLEVFVISKGELWRTRETIPAGSWTIWDSLGAPPATQLTAHSPVLCRDEHLEVFALGLDDDFLPSLWQITETLPGGAWSAWTPLEPLPHATQDTRGLYSSALSVPVVVHPDGHLEIFLVGPPDESLDLDPWLWHIEQQLPGRTWSTWNSLGSPPDASILPNTDVVAVITRNDHVRVFVIANDIWYWYTGE